MNELMNGKSNEWKNKVTWNEWLINERMNLKEWMNCQDLVKNELTGL